jgi:organic radical activating enzyme
MDNVVLHLMVNNKCTNDCPLCCNKQYDVGKIPVVTVEELKQTETICITGGEPFLSPYLTNLIFELIIQYKNIKNIYIYTSGEALSRDQISTLIFMQDYHNVNMGVSIGPKSEGDRKNIQSYLIYDKVAKLNHNRFYCFNNKDREIAELYYKNENTEIIDRKWQKDFIPASNTIFRRLPIWI